jgi:TRAP-type C4-dicarboxylate transport system substrate-binding protein
MKGKVLLVALVAVALTLTGVSAGMTQGKDVIKLKFSNPHPMTFSSAPVMAAFCDEIKKRTNGKVEITHYAGGTLTTFPKTYDGVVSGVADIGHSHIGYTRGRFPVTEILDLPVGYTSGFVATHVKWDYYKKFKPKEWDKVHVLYFWSVGPQILATTKKELKKFDDLKGMKIRGTGRPRHHQGHGATPVALEMGDVYDAVREAFLRAYTTQWRYGRASGSATCSNTATSPAWRRFDIHLLRGMNKRKWDSLPKDIQKIITDTAEEWVDKHAVTTLQADQPVWITCCRRAERFSPSRCRAEEDEGGRAARHRRLHEDDESKGSKKADMQAQLNYIYERIDYWSKQEKERKLKSPTKRNDCVKRRAFAPLLFVSGIKDGSRFQAKDKKGCTSFQEVPILPDGPKASPSSRSPSFCHPATLLSRHPGEGREPGKGLLQQKAHRRIPPEERYGRDVSNLSLFGGQLLSILLGFRPSSE